MIRGIRRIAARPLFACMLLVFSVGASAQQPLVASVEAVGMTVSDMDRAVDFYSRVLTFEKVSEQEMGGAEFEHLVGVFGARARVVRMSLGDEHIELTEFLAPRGRVIPADSRSNDRWFQHVAIIVSDMDQAYQHLRKNRVEHASTGPQRLPDWNKNAGGIEAFYFKDPDGHPLEILHFPAGKGAAKWHQASGGLFLGIDHTAIVVNDTDATLAFYRDLLGMKVVGESENYGTEQEHLNNVFGARLRISALRAANGFGIELLEYLAPRDGRPIPLDEKANDLAHRYTALASSQIGAADQTLVRNHAKLVSPGVVVFPNEKALTVRDPDGHVLELRATNGKGAVAVCQQ